MSVSLTQFKGVFAECELSVICFDLLMLKIKTTARRKFTRRLDAAIDQARNTLYSPANRPRSRLVVR